MIYFSTATLADLENVLALLELNQLPQAGVRDHFQDFVLALDADQVIACAGLEIYAGAGLLRSVAVHPDYRSQGLGAKLTESILDLAEHKKLSSVSLLTTTAEDYFPKFGFVKVNRSDLPESLKASEELRGACPDSAIAMMLEL